MNAPRLSGQSDPPGPPGLLLATVGALDLRLTRTPERGQPNPGVAWHQSEPRCFPLFGTFRGQRTWRDWCCHGDPGYPEDPPEDHPALWSFPARKNAQVHPDGHDNQSSPSTPLEWVPNDHWSVETATLWDDHSPARSADPFVSTSTDSQRAASKSSLLGFGLSWYTAQKSGRWPRISTSHPFQYHMKLVLFWKAFTFKVRCGAQGNIKGAHLFLSSDPDGFTSVPPERLILLRSIISNEKLTLMFLIPHVIVHKAMSFRVETSWIINKINEWLIIEKVQRLDGPLKKSDFLC